jgi:uncharacterized protein (UPF0303 family)
MEDGLARQADLDRERHTAGPGDGAQTCPQLPGSVQVEQEGRTLELMMGLSARDYASHGGSFPLHVEGVGCVGGVTVSGAPQREDHQIVVTALAELCGLPVAELALE